MGRDYGLSDPNMALSPDGKTLAVFVADPSGAIKVALLQVSSAGRTRMLDTRQCSGYLQFTPDGKAITYTVRENNVDNAWVQPLDGSAGHTITDFKSEQVWALSLSPDGKSLAVLRGHIDSDVVLLQETKP